MNTLLQTMRCGALLACVLGFAHGCASDGAIAAAAAKNMAPVSAPATPMSPSVTAPAAAPVVASAAPLTPAAAAPLPEAPSVAAIVPAAAPASLPADVPVTARAAPSLPKPVVTKPAPAPPPRPAVNAPTLARPSVPAPAAVAAPPVAVPALKAAPVSPPVLDMAGLTSRLRETRAIGVFTKLALKNQVDDLMAQFRQHYAADAAAAPAALREPYNLLVLKVLSLVQDDDPELARLLSGSREAIWGILADREKFQAAA